MSHADSSGIENERSRFLPFRNRAGFVWM